MFQTLFGVAEDEHAKCIEVSNISGNCHTKQEEILIQKSNVMWRCL